MISCLAAYGGSQTVTFPRPHYRWPILGPEEESLVVELIRRGEIAIYGKSGVVKELEDSFAAFCGAKYALSTNSGTCALFSAYFALGLKPGDEVIVPTYTFPATVTPLLHFPVRVVLCDADPITGNVTADTIQQCLSPRTTAVVITHMWGLPCPMDEILEICKKYSLRLVEDASHGLGASYNGKLVGTFGDVGCFSLQGNKMACAGEGGMLITNDVEIYDRATLFSSFRDRPRETVTSFNLLDYWETGFGLKMKIHPLAAAIALIQLQKAPTWIKERHIRLNRLSELLQIANGIEPPITPKNVSRGAWYGFKPLYDSKKLRDLPLEIYIQMLQAEGLEVHNPGTRPLHLTPLFSRFDDPRDAWGLKEKIRKVPSRAKINFPGAETYYSRAISVPTFTTEPIELVEEYGIAFQKIGNVYV